MVEVNQAMPSPVNRPLMASFSSEPGMVTSAPLRAMTVEMAPVIRNRMMNRVKGSGSLFPSFSTAVSRRSPAPRVGAVCAVSVSAMAISGSRRVRAMWLTTLPPADHEPVTARYRDRGRAASPRYDGGQWI